MTFNFPGCPTPLGVSDHYFILLLCRVFYFFIVLTNWTMGGLDIHQRKQSRQVPTQRNLKVKYPGNSLEFYCCIINIAFRNSIIDTILLFST